MCKILTGRQYLENDKLLLKRSVRFIEYIAFINKVKGVLQNVQS